MRTVLASKARPTVPWRARRAGEDYGVSAEPNWRGVDWRAHLHQVEIDGARVNYVDIGEGDAEPVVVVHGLSGQWQNWLENIPNIAQSRRVLALDLPGHGASEMPREQISIPGYGHCVESFCDRLELGPVAMVGNSMGGFVASEVAIQQPERVERLTLVSAAGISTTNVFRMPTRTVGRMASALLTYTAARQKRLAMRPGTRHMALAMVARYPGRLKADLAWEGFMTGAGKSGFEDAFRASLEYDFRHRLTEIGCPTLIVWGENDSVITVNDAHKFHELIPDSRKLVMKETGHVPMAERPTAFNEALRDFLSEAGEASEQEKREAA